MMKLFPSPRIPTDKIPECQPHIERGEHLKLYRFSQDAYREVAAVFNGPHPETGEELVVADEPHPEGAPATRPAAAAGRVRTELRARRRSSRSPSELREDAGLPDEPTGEVSEHSADPFGSTDAGIGGFAAPWRR